jgi:hypothetical protein
VLQKKYPLWFLDFFSFRQIYGMNIRILTIYMAGIVKLDMIQAFTAHQEMKLKQMATLLNIGSSITSFKSFI